MEHFDSNLILSIVQLITVTATPFIIWIIGKKWQNRQDKIAEKRRLFFTLMSKRKSYPIAREWVDALNCIDVVFQDNQKVRHAWREYLDSLDEKSQHYPNNESYCLDLLSEIAQELGYDNIRQTEIARFYSPIAFSNQDEKNTQLILEATKFYQNANKMMETKLNNQDIPN